MSTNEQPSVAILGAGLMGTAIAATHLKAGMEVMLYDPFSRPLAEAPQRIAAELELQQTDVSTLTNLKTTANLADLARYDILIETIPEKLRAKQKLYRSLVEVTQNHSPLLFTNTSTIAIADLAVAAPCPERFCGFHFFHPVRERSLVEIISSRETSPQTVQNAQLHAQLIAKQPITVGDGPGFLVNRLLNPYLNEALLMLESGTQLETIERVATDFGMAMGPFRIMDEIGLDVTLHAGWVLHKAFPDRAMASPLLMEMVRHEKLGRKTGCGFYCYDVSVSWQGTGTPNSVFLEKFLLPPSECKAATEQEIIDRLFYGMLLEAGRCVDDGIICSLETADLAVVHGLGFPSKYGGLTDWAKKIGIVALREKMFQLEKHYGLRFQAGNHFFQLLEDGPSAIISP